MTAIDRSLRLRADRLSASALRSLIDVRAVGLMGAAVSASCVAVAAVGIGRSRRCC